LVDFEGLVAGLAPGLQYHWRIRARYDLARTPFQCHGPWFHVQFSGWNEFDVRTAGTSPALSVPKSEVSGVARFELRAAGSNPARGGAALVLALAGRLSVHADVIDVTGRRVAVVVERETYDAGDHVLTWDGRGESGAEVAAGVYFLRVCAGGETRVRKVVLVR
jgi:hypothetical protein